MAWSSTSNKRPLPVQEFPVSFPTGVATLVGFSGGLDSTVLLHALAAAPAIRAAGLRAVHVHHGLRARLTRAAFVDLAGFAEPAANVGELGEPIQYGSDDMLPLLFDCGFRWVRSLDFNELALELLGDYQRDRMFRFQHIALAAPRTPVASWP